MKKILVLAVLVVAALVGYNFYTTGKITLIPPSLSEEELQVKSLEDQFESARTQFRQAGRGAALGGVDTSGDADAAALEIRRVAKSLSDLKRRLTSDDAKQAAERLHGEIQEFIKKNP